MASSSGGEASGGGRPEKDCSEERVGERKDGSEAKKPVVYGSSGKIWCMICRVKRDHLAVNCPGNACRRCGRSGHLQKDCKVPICQWCGETGHAVSGCPRRGTGGPVSTEAGKRKGSEEVPAPQRKVSEELC
ncbi:zinc finger CCHC domain-containing protein 13-like [Watersipora subatra]|uniref:zinc finger CCHC domain-containing protein 13-like n=1 Tax=Watersipora subatra TaxID=2589382 RepID=UPI00355BA7D5